MLLLPKRHLPNRRPIPSCCLPPFSAPVLEKHSSGCSDRASREQKGMQRSWSTQCGNKAFLSTSVPGTERQGSSHPPQAVLWGDEPHWQFLMGRTPSKHLIWRKGSQWEEGVMLKLKLQYFGHLIWRTDIGKDPDAGQDWSQEKRRTEDEMAG